MRYAEPGSGHSKLYDFLAAREEEAHQQPGYALPWTPEQPSYDGTPERLAAFCRGEPVDVPVSALPAWARPGARSSTGGGGRP